MPKPNNTSKNLRLQPKNNLVRRVIPALQAAIGDDLADMLCQIDYWARNTPDGWIAKSATNMQSAFPSWSIKKIQRVIKLGSTLGYIALANCPYIGKRTKTPMIRIEPFWFSDYAAVLHREGPYSYLPVSRVIFIPYGVDAPETPDPDPPECDKNVAPCDTGVAPLRQKRRTPTIYIDQEEKQESIQESEDGESLDHQPINSSQPTPSLSEQNLTFLTMLRAISNACVLDLKLNIDSITQTAEQLTNAGYTPADIATFADWWNNYDWRGKNGSKPHLSQIAKHIREALEHTPQTAANDYLSDEFSDYIAY